MIKARTQDTNESIYERKDEEQKKALDAWVNNNYNGTIIAATGVGKTRIMLLCAETLLEEYTEAEKKSKRFLFLSPLADLPDQIKGEAKKWGLDKKILPYVEFMTINKARTLKQQKFEGVFVDEVHLTLAIEKDTSARNFYLKNQIKHIAAFTATWPENREYGVYLTTIAPKVFDMGFEEANQKRLVSDYVLFKVPIQLTPNEKKKLSSANYMYNKCMYDLLGEVDPSRMFMDCKKILQPNSGASKSEKQIAFLFMKAVRDRRTLINHAESKFTSTAEVVSMLSAGTNKSRFLTFNGTIDLAEYVTELINKKCSKQRIRTKSYHSKMGVKNRRETLENFKTKRLITGLNTVDAANAGLDVPDLEYIVLNAITSKGLTMIQRVGRAARWVDGKTAKVVLHYVKDSQEERWMKNSLSSFKEVIDISNVSDIKSHI